MTMTPATLAALRGSILKWQRIVDQTDMDRGSDNCPLCQMFLQDNCEGCPVADRTGNSACEGSPYIDWHRSNPWGRDGTRRRVKTPAHLKAAEAELAFLISLLPPGEPPYLEDDCPGHVASADFSDPKVCARCGTHVDGLRPEDAQ